MNNYYSPINIARASIAKSAKENSDRAAVEAAFDLLPDVRRLQENRITYVTAGGTGDTITITFPMPLLGYVEGLRLMIRITADNTGPVTINIDGLGARNVVSFNKLPLEAGDVVIGDLLEVIYDGTRFVSLTVGLRSNSEPYDEVSPRDYGAVGDGVTDDTAAIQAALNANMPIRLDGIFRAMDWLTATQLRMSGEDNHTDGILWEGGSNHGLIVTPASYDDKIIMSRVGLFTAQTTPASTALTVDWEPLGTDYSAWARQHRRMDLDNVVIIGKDGAQTTYGWNGGIYMTRPQQCNIESCSIWGKFNATEYDTGDFESAFGIYVEPPATDDSVDMRIFDNTVYGWHDGIYIDSMEAVDMHENDLQVCYNGVTVHARITSRNQYRFMNNHFGCSGETMRLRNLRRFSIIGNDISYRWGSPSTDTRNMIKLDSAYRGIIVGNTIRAGAPANIALTGIRMEQTDASNVRDIVVSSNSFDGMEYLMGVDGATAPIDIAWSKTNLVRDLNQWYDDNGLGTANLLGGGVTSYNNTAETVTSSGTSVISILDYEQFFEFTESAGSAITRNIDLRTIQSPLPGAMVRLKLTFDNNPGSAFRLRSGSGGSVFHTVSNIPGTIFSVNVLCVYDGSAWTVLESSKINSQPNIIEAEPSQLITLLNNGDIGFEFTNNTTITLKGKGGDGVEREIAFTIS